MMKSFSMIALWASVLALSACMSTMPADDTAPRPASAATLAPVSLNVSQISVSTSYVSPMAAPNVEHTMDPAPAQVIEDMVRSRLVAAGGDKALRATVTEASVVSEALPVSEGFWGRFTNEPDMRYKANVAVRFEMFDPAAPDIVLGHAEVTANRNRNIMENATLGEKDRALQGLVMDLTDDVAKGLDGVVRQTFGTQ